MGNPAYITPLGGCLYLDNEGVRHHGATPSAPSYPLPNKVLSLMNDASKLSKTFKDIGGALPTKSGGTKIDDFAKKLKSLGTPDELSKIFGLIGTIATVVGNVFVVAGVVVAAAKPLGLFDEGPSPLEIRIKAMLGPQLAGSDRHAGDQRELAEHVGERERHRTDAHDSDHGGERGGEEDHDPQQRHQQDLGLHERQDGDDPDRDEDSPPARVVAERSATDGGRDAERVDAGHGPHLLCPRRPGRAPTCRRP